MNLIFLGAPGSGKGTQAKELAKIYDLVHLSTGDIIRNSIRKKTKLGLQVKKYLDAGLLVPDDHVIDIVKEAITNLKSDFILDGFPRTIKQANALQNILEDLEKKIDFVIYLEADLEHLTKRIVNRLICPQCNRTYNKIGLNPKVDNLCDDDNTPLIKRNDDSEDKIKLRIQSYLNETLPLVEYYEEEDLLHLVDANQSHKLVLATIRTIIDSV